MDLEVNSPSHPSHSSPPVPSSSSSQPAPANPSISAIKPTGSKIYIDSFQLGISCRYQDPAPLIPLFNNSALPPHLVLYTLGGKIKVNHHGFASIGNDHGGRFLFKLNGTRVFRAEHGLGDPVDANYKGRSLVVNQLTAAERDILDNSLSSEVWAGRQPWEWQAAKMLGVVGEARSIIFNLHSAAGNALVRPPQPRPIKVYRLQLYREYDAREMPPAHVMEELKKAIAQTGGYYSVKEEFTAISKRAGLLCSWHIPVRNVPRRKSYKEGAKLIAYHKGDRVRVEVSFESPTMCAGRDFGSIKDMDELREFVRLLASDAVERLNTIDGHMAAPPDLPVREQLFDALRGYGIRWPEGRKEFVVLVDQLAATGVYDPTRARLEHDVQIDFRVLREKLAHPQLGILTKLKSHSINGEGLKSLYRLRPDWTRALRLDDAHRQATGEHTCAAHEGSCVTHMGVNVCPMGVSVAPVGSGVDMVPLLR